MNEGNCPVRQLDQNEAVAGEPRWGVLYQGRLYLALKDGPPPVLQDPSRYAAVGVEEKGFCPHCIAKNGVLVQGNPNTACLGKVDVTGFQTLIIAKRSWLAPSDKVRR